MFEDDEFQKKFLRILGIGLLVFLMFITLAIFTACEPLKIMHDDLNELIQPVRF